MNLKVMTIDDQIICHLSGRLDTHGSLDLEPKIDEITHPEKVLVFDFTEVEYISSSFLRICIKKYKQLGTERFCVKNPTSDIKRVFKIAGLEKMIRE